MATMEVAVPIWVVVLICVAMVVVVQLIFSTRFKKGRRKTVVVLHIRENENAKSRCLGRVPYCDDRAAHLGGFRAFLEGFKENPIVPWPFDFWDTKLNKRIATAVERVSDLEMHGHVVTVIRSQSMTGQESMATAGPPTAQESSDSGSTKSAGDHSIAALPLVSSSPFSSASCNRSSISCERDVFFEKTSPPKQERKHKIFLSHSGAQKPFVEQLCKDLESHDHFPFFDQRDDSLPKGKEFAPILFDAAKQCKVAVMVLSREYLSSKWPMLELAEFVRAKRSDNKSLELFPLFYKASIADLSDKSIENEWRPIWMELVLSDRDLDRDDIVEEWAEAVRKLRGVNGPIFEQFGKSEVKYRDDIVNQIFRLAPPDLLYDTSEISGCDRICKELASKFLPHTRTSAEVLGLYGMGGLGKTTFSMSLCNHFNHEYSGKVCYIDVKDEMKALERQQMVMRKLLNLDDRVLQNVRHLSQGWEIFQRRIKECPVFLVIDNVQPNQVSKEEAFKYLNTEYKLGSKIMIISRSPDVIEDLLGEPRYCCKMPCLTREEAAAVFLQTGAPQIKDYFSLTADQRRVVESCLEEAYFSDQGLHGEKPSNQDKTGHYHPLALRALGVFVHERSRTLDILSWKSYLHEYGKLKSTRESYTRMFDILGLQFNTLDKMAKLMFLDISLYASKALETPMLSNSPLEDLKTWLANVYEEPVEVVEPKIFDLKRFAMINIERDEIIIHDLYKEYAIWYLEQATDEERLGVWCVGKLEGLDSSLPRELRSTLIGRCWRYLKRIRLQYIMCDNFSEWKVQEWCNIEVLQIVGCDCLTTMNLEALICLRNLELKDLWNLRTLTFTGYGRTHQRYSLPPLQFVIIDGLSSLDRLPPFSPFTSLKCLKIGFCEGLTESPSVRQCSSLERVLMVWYPKQETLPRLDGLTSLRYLTIICCDILSFQNRALKLEDLCSSSSLAALGLRNIPLEDGTALENVTFVEYVVLGGMDYMTSLTPLRQLRNHLATSSLQAFRVWRYYRPDNRQEGLEELCSLINLKLEGSEARESTVRAVSHTPCMTLIPNAGLYRNRPRASPDLLAPKSLQFWESREFPAFQENGELPNYMIEVKLSLKKNIKFVSHDLETDLKRENMRICVERNNIVVTGIIPENGFSEENVLDIVQRHDPGAIMISFRITFS